MKICPLSEIKLNELTKKFPKLNANILGVIRDENLSFLKNDDEKNDKAYVIINSHQMKNTFTFGHTKKFQIKF